mgnify:CR=1 FL=1
MSVTHRKTEVDEIRFRAENDLFYFAQLVNPQYIYGDVHEEVFRWLSSQDASNNQLILLPRAHLKSHCIATWVNWAVTKDPATSIIYLTAGEDLAKAQMYAIKRVFTSDTYRTIWPDMIGREEGKRDTWSAYAINVDHPAREEAGTRDNTILIKTIKSNFAGLHCESIVYDDIVVPGNAYTGIGRTEVRRAVSQSASVLNPGGIIKCVGTRYHPIDIYNDFKEEMIPEFNDTGEIVGERQAWDIFEKKAEDRGDLTGLFLWPRTKCVKTHKWYGFDNKILAGIRAKYYALGERAQYHAQYYNEPNDPESARLDNDQFQYYDKKHLQLINGDWHFKDNKLNIYAAVDFAFTDSTRSDYTAMVTIGRDYKGRIYVLDLVQFRTSKYETYYTEIIKMHRRWEFRRVKVESNAGANIIANYIKERIREEGLSLTIDAKNTSAGAGKKEQRIAATLEPRYENGDMWHYRSGLTMELEEQLVQERPPHDDLKDALAAAVEISVSPARFGINKKVVNVKTHARFGGLLR